MIGNKYLKALYEYPDRDTSINQLLEVLKFKDQDFINSLYNDIPSLDDIDEDEREFLTIVSSLVDYVFQLNNQVVPDWVRSEKFIFETPYYYSRRLSDFDKVKLLFTNPSPFRLRNVYFDLNSLTRC